MSKYIVIDGDILLFDAMSFGKALPIPVPTNIKGSGHFTINGKKICIDGDEKKVKLMTAYTAPPYIVPGQAEITVKKLNKDQWAKYVMSEKKVIIVGSQCTATLRVLLPAMQITPSGPQPDQTKSYSGKGQFMTTNTLVATS